MYIDLVRWKLVNIPATGDLRLQTFWGSSSLNICMYEKTGNTTQHLDKDNKYAFSIRAQYLGDKPNSDINDSRRGGEGSDTESVTLFPWAEHKREPSVASIPEIMSPEQDLPRSESQVFTSVDLSLSPIQYRDEMKAKEQEEESELNFFDAEQGHHDSTTRDIESVDSSELLRLADLVCPFWIEQYRGSSSVTLFAIQQGFRDHFSTESFLRRPGFECYEPRTLEEGQAWFSAHVVSRAIEAFRRHYTIGSWDVRSNRGSHQYISFRQREPGKLLSGRNGLKQRSNKEVSRDCWSGTQ